MKIINPYKNSAIPLIVMGEPFMLWCNKTNTYHRAVAVDWYSSGVIIRDTQNTDEDRLQFTVANGRDITNDLFKALDEVTSFIRNKNYIISFKNRRG